MKRTTTTLAALAVAAGLAIAGAPSAQAVQLVPVPPIAVPVHPPLPRLCLVKVGKKHHKRWVRTCFVHHELPVVGGGVPIPQPPTHTE